MFDLAYDSSGEPVTLPTAAVSFRVRRFRNPGMRGAPENVHDRDGGILQIPVDLGYVEFRQLVDGVPGRYRLDAMDESGRGVANTPPCYVTLTEPPRKTAQVAAEDRDSLIRELARTNADMVKTIAERFSGMMQAAAELVRAADSAGLPRREPPVREPDPEPEAGDDEEDDESPDLVELVAQVLPAIQLWLTSRAAERAQSETSTTAAAPAAPTMWVAPSVISIADAPGVSQPVAEAEGATASRDPHLADGTTGETKPQTDRSVVEARNAAASPTTAQLAHLAAVRARLTPEEIAVIDVAVARMSSEILAQWLAELSARPIDDSVAFVRSLMPRLRTRARPPEEQ